MRAKASNNTNYIKGKLINYDMIPDFHKTCVRRTKLSKIKLYEWVHLYGTTVYKSLNKIVSNYETLFVF